MELFNLDKHNKENTQGKYNILQPLFLSGLLGYVIDDTIRKHEKIAITLKASKWTWLYTDKETAPELRKSNRGRIQWKWSVMLLCVSYKEILEAVEIRSDG